MLIVYWKNEPYEPHSLVVMLKFVKNPARYIYHHRLPSGKKTLMCNCRLKFVAVSIYRIDLSISQPTDMLVQSGLRCLFRCIRLVFHPFQHSFQPLACTHSIYKCFEPLFLEITYPTLIRLN